MNFEEQQKALADSLASHGLTADFGPPPMQMPTTEIDTRPMTMPTTEISAAAPLQMPVTDIVSPLLPGQHADPPPVAVKPAAIGTPSPFVDDSAMSHKFVNYGNPSDLQSMQPHVTPIATGPSPFVDTSAVTSPIPGQSAQPAAPPPDPNGVIPPATYVPAHFDDSRVNVTPETRNDIDQTYDAQADAQKNMALSQALQSRVTADAMAQEADRANQSIANQQAKEDERQQFVKSHLARLDTLSQDLSNQTVNPHQWWDNANLFQKAMAGIAITLGGGPAAVNGGHNVGLDMVNSAIQSNIDAQKTNLDLKRAGLHEQGNVLEQYRQAFGDERMGELALEHGMRENAIQKMQADAMGSQSPQITAAANNAVAQLRRQQDLTKANFEQLAYVRAHMAGGGQPMQKVDPGLLVKAPNGENFAAPSKDEAEKLRQKSGMLQNIKDNVNDILAIRKSAGALELKNPYSNASRQIEAKVNDAKLNMAMFNSGGSRMNQADVESNNAILDSARDLTGNPDQVLMGVNKMFDQHFTNELRALGSEQVQRGYTKDPQGRIEPGAAYLGKSDVPRTGGIAPSSFKPAGQ